MIIYRGQEERNKDCRHKDKHCRRRSRPEEPCMREEQQPVAQQRCGQQREQRPVAPLPGQLQHGSPHERCMRRRMELQRLLGPNRLNRQRRERRKQLPGKREHEVIVISKYEFVNNIKLNVRKK